MEGKTNYQVPVIRPAIPGGKVLITKPHTAEVKPPPRMQQAMRRLAEKMHIIGIVVILLGFSIPVFLPAFI